MNVIQQRQEGLVQLKKIANKKGYLVFDDIISVTDNLGLSITEVDRISATLQQYGVIVYIDSPPALSSDEVEKYEDYGQINYEQLYLDIIRENPDLSTFISEVRDIIPPQSGEFNLLISQAKDGNKFAFDRIYMSNLRHVVRISWNKCKLNNNELADVIQIGSMGLLKAIKKFDPNGFQIFGSYASLWISQYIDRFSPSIQPLIYLPAHIKFLVYQALSIINEIESPDLPYENNKFLVVKIADKLHIDFEKAELVLHYCNQPLYLNDISMEELETHFIDESNAESINQNILQDTFETMFLNVLKKREEEIIKLRFGFNDGKEKTLQEIADLKGLTRERIRQIETKALSRLINAANRYGLYDLL